jgi:Mn2+/Fe2+ NRAMP family transporter
MPVPHPAPAEVHQQQPWRSALLRLGPGIVTGASDVDPALVLTATVAGAAYRYSLLWVVILCVPFLVTVFAVSARLGYETRQGLVDLLRSNYGRGVALACAGLVIVINMAMIIADLMAVSDAFSIITGQHRAFFIAATAFSIWYILIFHNYRKITKALLWLSIPLFIYVVTAIVTAPPHSLMMKTFLPRMGKDPGYVAAIVALFGSLLTPYVLLWQTSSRREHAAIGVEHPTDAESHMGTFVVTLLSFSVMVSSASVLHLAHPVDMTTREAAEALRPVVGNLGQALFALGIIGAGTVALPVLVASMCYSISEAMGWKSGLSEHPWEAKGFYVLISAAMLFASAVNFVRINPVKALYWSQIVAGALTPPILLFIMILSNDRRVIRTTNTKWQNFWLGACAGGLLAAELAWLWWSL